MLGYFATEEEAARAYNRHLSTLVGIDIKYNDVADTCTYRPPPHVMASLTRKRRKIITD